MDTDLNIFDLKDSFNNNLLHSTLCEFNEDVLTKMTKDK